MKFDPNKPYNDLPLLPPKAEVESKQILKKAISTIKALAPQAPRYTSFKKRVKAKTMKDVL